MSNASVFDIMGPIMIGPSSSHTAGAVRLGRAAKIICNDIFTEVVFNLHGSFAKTYKGHGSDKALIAGILGMETDDERIRSSFEIAEEQNIKITFKEIDLGEVHPNSVKIDLIKEDGDVFSMTGCSVGGGDILITHVEDDDVSLSGKYPVIIIHHTDKPGMLSKISLVIALQIINIATLKVSRHLKGETATSVIETDNLISQDALRELRGIDSVISVRILGKV